MPTKTGKITRNDIRQAFKDSRNGRMTNYCCPVARVGTRLFNKKYSAGYKCGRFVGQSECRIQHNVKNNQVGTTFPGRFDSLSSSVRGLKSADAVYKTLQAEFPGLIVEFVYEDWMLQ